ncbi:hypothetical protein HWV62_34161 [Athelia sp. TMB]|nr:hypothetical protein HWV62_34161 [Athelia sp. TMB]
MPGSGITIYIVQVNFAAVNVSIVVDNLQPTYRTYAEPQYYLHNFSLFDIQELPSGPHTVNIALLDSSYSSGDRYAYPNGTSALVFDYAVVNEINVAGSSTPSTAAPQPSATPSTTPAPAPAPSSSASKTPLGAIVGGVVGGLALIMAAVVLYLCRHRIAASSRRRHPEIDPEPHDVRRTTLQDHGPSPPTSAGYAQSSFDAARLYRPDSRTSYSTAQQPYPHSIAPGHGEMSEIGYAPSSSAYSSGKDRRGYGSGSTGLTPATELAYQRFSGRSSIDSGGTGVPGQAPSVAPLGLRSGGVPSPSRSSVSQSVVSRALSEIPSINAARASQLTPEQLDFVHNLIGLNVPAADIAGVMERMRLEGEEGEANRRMGLGVERGVLGRGDVKAAPTNEALPDYEPPSTQ